MRISAPVPLIRNASDSLANADLVGTLGDGDEHNVDDSDPADRQCDHTIRASSSRFPIPRKMARL